MNVSPKVNAFFSQIWNSPPVQWVAAHRIETAGIAAACVVIAAGTGYWHWNTSNYNYGCGLRLDISDEMRAALAKHRPTKSVPTKETFEEAQTLLAAGWGVGGTRKEEPVTIDIGGGKQITLIPHRGRPNFDGDSYEFKGSDGKTESWRQRVEDAFGSSGRYGFLASFALMESGVDALAVIDKTTDEIILVVPGLNPAFTNLPKLRQQLNDGNQAWRGEFGKPSEALLGITNWLHQQYPDKPITKVYSQSMGAAFVLPVVAMNPGMQSFRITGSGINGYGEQQLSNFIAGHGGGVLPPEDLLARFAKQQVTINPYPAVDTWTHGYPLPNTYALWTPGLQVPPAWTVNTVYNGFGWVMSSTHRGSQTLAQLTAENAEFARVKASSTTEFPWTCKGTAQALKLQAERGNKAQGGNIPPWNLLGAQQALQQFGFYIR